MIQKQCVSNQGILQTFSREHSADFESTGNELEQLAVENISEDDQQLASLIKLN